MTKEEDFKAFEEVKIIFACLLGVLFVFVFILLLVSFGIF